MGSHGRYVSYCDCCFFVIVFREGVLFCRACNIGLGNGRNVQRHRTCWKHMQQQTSTEPLPAAVCEILSLVDSICRPTMDEIRNRGIDLFDGSYSRRQEEIRGSYIGSFHELLPTGCAVCGSFQVPTEPSITVRIEDLPVPLLQFSEGDTRIFWAVYMLFITTMGRTTCTHRTLKRDWQRYATAAIPNCRQESCQIQPSLVDGTLEGPANYRNCCRS